MTRSNQLNLSAHGGDLTTAQTDWKGTILDFSVNLNPLGPPPAVLEAVHTALDRVTEYPDPQCRGLKAAIAQRDRVEPAWVSCGNGASEVIYRLAAAIRPRRALVTAPTFSEYESALTAVGCQMKYHLLSPEQEFSVGEEFLPAITPDIDLVILCSPNNPTGQRVSPSLMERILIRCSEIGSRLMVDECFLELASDGTSLTALLPNPNLFLLRAFTKSYAIPGLRLGYGLCSDAWLLREMEAIGPCWNVSGPAQAAGIACCYCPDWPTQGRHMIEQERPTLVRQLTALSCRVIPSQANYLLFQLPGDNDLQKRLLRQGILIRNCGNYRGLGHDWYRIAIRTAAENQTLLRAMQRSLQP